MWNDNEMNGRKFLTYALASPFGIGGRAVAYGTCNSLDKMARLMA